MAACGPQPRKARGSVKQCLHCHPFLWLKPHCCAAACVYGHQPVWLSASYACNMSSMVADRPVDQAWVEQELRGVLAVFKEHEARVNELAQTQQAIQTEMQARSDLHAAMKEIAGTVMAAKGEIDLTRASLASKETEIAEIVKEVKKMMETMAAMNQKHEVGHAMNKQELGKVAEEGARIGARQEQLRLGTEAAMSDLTVRLLSSEQRLNAALSDVEHRLLGDVEQRLHAKMGELAARLDTGLAGIQQQVRQSGLQSGRSAGEAAATPTAATGAAFGHAGLPGMPASFAISSEADHDDRRAGPGTSQMMKGVMKNMTLRKVFEGKAEEWKEWKDDLEEFWELHHTGAKAALQELAATGDATALETALGRQAAEGKATMHALLRTLTAGEARKITSGYEADEAWASWRSLCKHYEPVMAVQNHQERGGGRRWSMWEQTQCN